VKSTSGQIQDGERRRNWTYVNRNNSAADYSISLKFGAEFDHMTADTLQTFKIEGSQVEVAAWRNVIIMTGTDRLTDLKLGETFTNAEHNLQRTFIV